MKKREALALLTTELKSRLAAETLAAILAVAAENEDLEERHAWLTGQIAAAELSLETVRERVQRDDVAGRERLADAQRQAEELEHNARTRIQVIEWESAARAREAAQKARDDEAAAKHLAKSELADLRALIDQERAELAKIRGLIEAARQSFAPLMGQA